LKQIIHYTCTDYNYDTRLNDPDQRKIKCTDIMTELR